MKGVVDQYGRALIPLHVRRTEDDPAHEFIAWIDTAFDGELVLPLHAIERLGLEEGATVRAVLADGTSTLFAAYTCFVDWLDGPRAIEVVANEGQFPLLGIGLLNHWRLTVDYRSRQSRIE